MLEPYVAYARSTGMPLMRPLLRAVLPNVAPGLLAQAAVAIGYGVTLEATPSFLCLGAQPPKPLAEWPLGDADPERDHRDWGVVISAIRMGGGLPDRIRTCGLRFRKPSLYPAELRGDRKFDPSCTCLKLKP
jgi:hypothetical protein